MDENLDFSAFTIEVYATAADFSHHFARIQKMRTAEGCTDVYRVPMAALYCG